MLNLEIFEQQPRKLVYGLAVILCTIFLWQAYKLWAQEDYQEVSRSIASSSAPEFDIAHITERNLFNTTSATLTASSSSPVQESSVELVLQAIFESADAQNSKAIIAAPGKSAKAYTVGSQVIDGISIDSIERESVVLNNRGRLETLRFPELNRSPAMAGGIASSGPNQRVSASVSDTRVHDTRVPDDEAVPSQTRSLREMMKKLPAADKVDLVRERLEQLRRQSKQQH